MTSNTLLRAARRTFIAGRGGTSCRRRRCPVLRDADICRGGGPASVADLAQGLLGAVVNISTSQTVKGTEGPGACRCRSCPRARPSRISSTTSSRTGRATGRRRQKVQSLGSGFVIDAEQGIIVTNNHVIADADEIEVNFTDGSKLKAKLVGTDTKTDIAVLKVDPKAHKLTAVKFGNSDARCASATG